MHDDRVHARMALVRDLFGLTVEEGVGSEALEEPLPQEAAEQLAEVRELPKRAPAGGR
jgi:hypothetical protein